MNSARPLRRAGRRFTLHFAAPDAIKPRKFTRGLAAAGAAPGAVVIVDSAEPLGRLHEVLMRQGKGRGRVKLVSRIDAATEVEIDLPGGFAVSPAVLRTLRDIPGIVDVREI